MAEAFRFDLVAPERRLASEEASAVQIPGADGDMTVMAAHTPVVATLRPGLLRVETGGQTQEYVVTGGFAEIGAEGVTVLAERALPRGEATQEIIDAWVEEAAQAHRVARDQAAEQPHGAVDETAKLLSDMVAMGGHIGLSPKQPNL